MRRVHNGQPTSTEFEKYLKEYKQVADLSQLLAIPTEAATKRDTHYPRIGMILISMVITDRTVLHPRRVQQLGTGSALAHHQGTETELLMRRSGHSHPQVKMSNATTDIRDFGLRYAAAWCSHDPARVGSYYAPDGRLSVNDGPAAVGPAGVAELARGFMTTFPDLNVAMDKLVESGDRIEFYWTLTGTHDGRRVRVSGVESWKLSPSGLIAESLGSFDAVDYDRQMFGNRKSSDTSSLE